MSTVAELWAERELRHDAYGWTALRTFDVAGVSTKAEAIAAVGIAKDDEHKDLPALRAMQPGAVPIRPNVKDRWKVYVLYREPSIVPPVITAHGAFEPAPLDAARPTGRVALLS